MNRNFASILALVVLAGGLLLMINSVGWGSQAANNYLLSQGGGMDSGQFMIVLQESIQTYRWVGMVLSFLSGFGFLRTMENGSGTRP
ncbi:MAG TPA: hypothetical protein VHO49_03685 [Anaerolineales bacterium]|nr:hypothetical protein [Anaerolineales bacterium]